MSRSPKIARLEALLLGLHPGALESIIQMNFKGGRNAKANKEAAYKDLFNNVDRLYKIFSSLTLSQFTIDLEYIRNNIEANKSTNSTTSSSSSSTTIAITQYCPTAHYMNRMRTRLALFFGIDSGARCLMNNASGTVRNKRDKPDTPTMQCTQFTLLDHSQSITVNQLQNVGQYRSTMKFQEEKEQMIDVVKFIHTQRATNPERKANDLMDDFFAFRSVQWPATLDLLNKSSAPSTLTMADKFTSDDLVEKLVKNATIQKREAAALASVALASATAEAAAIAVNESSSSSSSSSAPPVPLSPHVPLPSPSLSEIFGTTENDSTIDPLDIVKALTSLLLDLNDTATDAIKQSSQLSSAGLSQYGDDIFTVVESIIITIACSTGYSNEKLRTDIYNPCKILLTKLGLNAPLKGMNQYLASQHPEYAETLKLVIAHQSGGALQGEGAVLDYIKVAQKEFAKISRLHQAVTNERNLSPSYEEEPRVPVAFMFDAANATNSPLEHVKGSVSTCTAGLTFGGQGPIGFTGTGVAPTNQWQGKDSHSHTDLQLQPNLSAMKKLEEGTKMLKDHLLQEVKIDQYIALDGAASRGSMGLKGASSKTPLDFNPAATWMFKVLYHEGRPLSGLASYNFKKAWEQIAPNINKIILEKYSGAELKRPTIPLSLLRKTFQSCFHSVSTAAKYIMKVLFRLAHQLGTAHLLSKAIKNLTGYSVTYSVAKANGKDVVVLSGGLSAGMYIELLCSEYKAIIAAICNGDGITDPVDEIITEHLTDVCSNFAINSVFVLLSLPHEFEVSKFYLQGYVAREHKWQMKFGVILGWIYLTPTMLNRKWVLARHMNDIIVKHGVTLPDVANEETVEELRKFFQYFASFFLNSLWSSYLILILYSLFFFIFLELSSHIFR